MIKSGDKVRFLNKTDGLSVLDLKENYGVDIIKDCYGIFICSGRCNIYNKHTNRMLGHDDGWDFNESDLVLFTEINYDQLTEIEE